MSRVGLGCRSYGNAAAGMHQWTLGEDAAAPFFRQERDATLLVDIAPDCVMGSVQPTPDGTRYEGYDASFSSWKALIDDTTSALSCLICG